MSQFYTRRGDHGYTGWLGEGRVPKNHPRLEAVGAIDEAVAALGMARAACQSPDSGEILLKIQRDLYHLMAEVSATPENASKFREIDPARVTWLEEQIQRISQVVEVPNEFILPGDSFSAAVVAMARTIVRRAERKVVALNLEEELENPDLLRYINRLSSLCFSLELLEIDISGNKTVTLAKGGKD
jgi:cob(I)alamin adenosyltransferase